MVEELIEQKNNKPDDKYVSRTSDKIQYTEHFERYFDSHIKDIIASITGKYDS